MFDPIEQAQSCPQPSNYVAEQHGRY